MTDYISHLEGQVGRITKMRDKYRRLSTEIPRSTYANIWAGLADELTRALEGK